MVQKLYGNKILQFASKSFGYKVDRILILWKPRFILDVIVIYSRFPSDFNFMLLPLTVKL